MGIGVGTFWAKMWQSGMCHRERETLNHLNGLLLQGGFFICAGAHCALHILVCRCYQDRCIPGHMQKSGLQDTYH